MNPEAKAKWGFTVSWHFRDSPASRDFWPLHFAVFLTAEAATEAKRGGWRGAAERAPAAQR